MCFDLMYMYKFLSQTNTVYVTYNSNEPRSCNTYLEYFPVTEYMYLELYTLV